MRVFLLDVNVLLALAWPNHVHHAPARSWFHRRGRHGWSTCPMTQCGFVRISSNPSIIPDAVSPAVALAVLKQMVAHPGHHFWADEVSMGDPDFSFPSLLAGHRQVTDGYLLALAIRHNGVLATFDSGVRELNPDGRHVELLSGAG